MAQAGKLFDKKNGTAAQGGNQDAKAEGASRFYIPPYLLLLYLYTLLTIWDYMFASYARSSCDGDAIGWDLQDHGQTQPSEWRYAAVDGCGDVIFAEVNSSVMYALYLSL